MSAARILVVDDNPSDSDLIRIAFEMASMHVEVEAVSDGIEAMRTLIKAASERTLPALVLLDLNMPKATGFEVLDFMCVKRLVEQVPVVVLSTSHRTVDRRRCLALGARAMHSKPGTIQELRVLVEDFRGYLGLPGDPTPVSSA